MKALLSAMAVLVLVPAAMGCGRKDPVEEIHKARQQFAEVKVLGSVPDPDQNRLLVQLLLSKEGKRPLDTLTLKVVQKNAKGGVLRTDHVPLDVSSWSNYEGREISFQVPLGGDVGQLAFEVETELTPGVDYPEFTSPGQGGGNR